jgi:hypothetical protein
MQKVGKSNWANLFGFRFLKWGPVQTPQGRSGRSPGGSLRLIASSMGPAFQEWDPQISKWDPKLITATYWG